MLPLLLDDDPHIYFLTHQSSRKVMEVAARPRVGLTIIGASNCYLSVVGRAYASRDPELIKRLWRPLSGLVPRWPTGSRRPRFFVWSWSGSTTGSRRGAESFGCFRPSRHSLPVKRLIRRGRRLMACDRDVFENNGSPVINPLFLRDDCQSRRRCSGIPGRPRFATDT
jgi:Pyridoxamine 5'-phosphate oxidase like